MGESGRFYSTAEVADTLHYTRAWITELCRLGKIRAVKPTSDSGRFRVPASELARLRRDGVPGPSAPAKAPKPAPAQEPTPTAVSPSPAPAVVRVAVPKEVRAVMDGKARQPAVAGKPAEGSENEGQSGTDGDSGGSGKPRGSGLLTWGFGG